MDNKDKPAFPEPYLNDPNLALSTQPGLTKREYFAAMAMQGFLANPNISNAFSDENTIDEHDSILSITCVRLAERLLKQLENEAKI